jgi:hypothetical protein
MEYRFWYTASAVPRYQCSPTRFCGGRDLDELAELFRDDVPAHADVAVERERLVLRGDEDRRSPELMQLLSVKSMMR